ncbi:MAG: zf-HC2 domain-containing protein [Candidatus Omnitrophota bacterium]
MQDKLGRLIRGGYRHWKAGHLKEQKPHPDEETLVCFLEGKLAAKERDGVMEHLLSCSSCAELLAIQAGLPENQDKDVPGFVLEAAKNLVKAKNISGVLEILLKLKEEALEIINTTGDVLVGNEFMPAPVLRARKTKGFKDEVVILKDFKEIRIEAKIENKRGQAFNLTVAAKEKKTQKLIPNLRITLLKDGLELESYLAVNSAVVFENIQVGKYMVEVSTIEDKIASILLDIKN